MLVASDFREKARAALNGKWALGVGAGFAASLLGTYTVFNNAVIRTEAVQEERLERMLSPETYAIVADIVPILVTIAALWGFIMLIFGGPVSLGYAKFNLDLADGRSPVFKDLFSQLHRFGEGFLVRFLRLLFVGLWTVAILLPCCILVMIVVSFSVKGLEALFMLIYGILLACIPAVIVVGIKTYSYSMAAYIMYENPGMSANAAIKQSVSLMQGNKWRLFCLSFSFIGWSLLSIFTLFIGLLWIKPYQEAAYAAFYREIYRERYGEPVKAQNTYPYGQDNLYQGYSQGFNDFKK